MTKETFLAVYDYGQGGVWVLIDARSSGEISAKYPELSVVADKPEWLTDETLDEIRTKMHFDIDDEPNGWLLTLVGNR
jgi:hypothetical protein